MSGKIINLAEIRARKCENCKWHRAGWGACENPRNDYSAMETYIKTGGYCPLWEPEGKKEDTAHG